MMLMIDNYDSFTYNLVQYFSELGEDVVVHRNDEITIDEIAKLNPARIVLSPGPGTPADAGICKQVVETYAGKIPMLGVCLGHQCIGEVYGGKISHGREIMHGKTSMVQHDCGPMYIDLPQPFQATRYHSLVIEPQGFPDCLTVTSWTLTADGNIEEIMGLQHKDLPVYGVQFHPESILTPEGKTLLNNFLKLH